MIKKYTAISIIFLCSTAYAMQPDDAQPQSMQEYVHNNISKTRSGNPEDKDEGHANLLAVFPNYLRQQPESGVEQLIRLTQESSEYYLPSMPFVWRDRQAMQQTPLRYLALLRQAQPTAFEQAIERIKTTQFNAMLDCALHKPEWMQPFATTSLSLESLIKQALSVPMITSDETEKHTKGFKTLLLYGRRFHQQYEDRIAERLAEKIQQGHYNLSMDEILTSPSEKVRTTAFLGFVNRLGAMTTTDRDLYFTFYRLLSVNFTGVFNGKPAADAYAHCYTVWKSADNLPGIQLLWEKMARLEDAQIQMAMATMLSDYFGVNVEVQQPTQMLSQAILAALINKTVVQEHLDQFLIEAQRTELIRLFDPSIILPYKIDGLVDEQRRLDVRYNYLIDLIQAQRRQQQLPINLQEKIQQLPNSFFKQYATLLLGALSQQSSYAYYAKRRALRELHQQCSTLDPNPSCLESLDTIYDSLVWPVRQCRYLKDHLKKPRIDGGMLLAFYENPVVAPALNSVLCAYDLTDGYPLWERQSVDKDVPIAHSDDCIFVATRENHIVGLDKGNGMQIHTLLPDSDEPCEGLFWLDTSKKLVARFTSHFYIYDPATKNLEIIQAIAKIKDIFQQAAKDNRAAVVANIKNPNFFGLTKELLVLTANGKQQILSLDDKHLWSGNCTSSRQGLFLHNDNVGESMEAKQIICFDPETLEKKWHYNQPAEILEAPRFSPNGDVMYFISSNSIVALALNDIHNGAPRELWRIPIPSHYNRLVVSRDGSTLFAVATKEKYDGFNLSKYNTNTGAHIEYANVPIPQRPRSHCEATIIGESDGQLLIQR